MNRHSSVGALLRLALNVGGGLLLFCGFNVAIVSPTLMKLVDLGPLGEEVEYSAFVWKFGIVSFLCGAGGLFFANVRRVPLLSGTDTEIGAADSSKTVEWLGVAGMVFVCIWLLGRAAWLTSSQSSGSQSPADPLVFVLFTNFAVQGLALFGFVFNTFAHLWLTRFPSERGVALALASACVQTGVVAAAIAIADIIRRGLSGLSAEASRPKYSPEILVAAHVLFVTSLLIIAWSRRRPPAQP